MHLDKLGTRAKSCNPSQHSATDTVSNHRPGVSRQFTEDRKVGLEFYRSPRMILLYSNLLGPLSQEVAMPWMTNSDEHEEVMGSGLQTSFREEDLPTFNHQNVCVYVLVSLHFYFCLSQNVEWFSLPVVELCFLMHGSNILSMAPVTTYRPSFSSAPKKDQN